MAKTQFLRAQWNNLLMVNYGVDPAILMPYVPPGTVLDLWQGKALVSMVGFLFLDTRVLGIKWPFHRNFEEVNLRFYVKHFDGKEWKRGAVFISEIVPKPMIVLIANNLYKEHYTAMPMRHSIDRTSTDSTKYHYEWKLNAKWNRLGATVSSKVDAMVSGSPEEFIFEHYWGYNKASKTSTYEYQVEHVSWNTRQVTDPVFEADIAALYGREFEPYLSVEPYSAFFADGSEIIVRAAGRILFNPAIQAVPAL
ncbi:MAG: YqjF family protein [Mucilaginibacter sp.]